MYVCRPVQTVKAQRWLVTTSLFGAALGLALLAFGGPKHQATVSPGNVASVHQAVADDCSACHQIGDSGAIEIFAASLSGRAATDQNSLCLRCHQEFSEHDRLPHTTSADLLTLKTSVARRGSLFVEATRALFDVPHELACASCHREHHGADNDLTEIADRQCQICHTNRFHSFSEDHPSFSDYPLARRSEIYFDHATHYGGHFADYLRTAPDGVAPGKIAEIADASSATCAKCHELDDSGAYMLSLGYKSTCASCHDGQIWDLAMPAMPVLSLCFPVEADRPAFQAWGFERGPFDLPPIMRLLLAGDERFAEVYSELQSSSWQSAAALVEGRSAQVAPLAAAMFDLMMALSNDPRGTISQRLTAVGRDRLSPAQIQRLARITTNANFVANVRRMAELLSERRATALDPEADSASTSADRPAAAPPAAGWSFDEQSGTLSYRPREHADSVMREWTEVAAVILAADRFTTTSARRDDAEHDAVQTAAEYFTKPIAAGRCVKCHTVDRVSDRLHVNWYAKHRAVGRDELTFFRHAPHIVMLPGQDRCITCHELQRESVLFRPEFFASGDHINIDASPGASCGFPQISGAVACASCHHRSGASQRCTTCHHYHARKAASDASARSPL
jgi:hypothetical protein